MNWENIDRSLDGQLSPEEWETLERAIIDDPEMRREYVERRWLHAHLIAERDSLGSLLAENNLAEKPRQPWLKIAAALALLGLVGFAVSSQSVPPTVATLTEAEGCRWEGSDLPTKEGARLGIGTLALAEGMATIQFDSGATVTLEAPAVLEVESTMRCRLVEGSVVADVPESAHGFTINTEKMEVIDLGTRFGVTTTPIGGSHVFVFDGEVKVIRDEMAEAQHIFGGKSLHLGAAPTTPDQEISREVEPIAQDGNWTAVSTAVGRGKDAFVRREDAHGPTGAQPVLMVKHTNLAPGNERRAVLTFDMSAMPDHEFEAARLTLKVESTGLGFSSLVPDSRFAVYGVNDAQLDKWSESALTWENGGAFVSEPLDPGQFTKLAGFTIKKGSPNELIDVSSDALRDFLRQHKDLATFVLIRETGELDKQGLVHAFASREHPTDPAPTLWFKTAPSE